MIYHSIKSKYSVLLIISDGCVYFYRQSVLSRFYFSLLRLYELRSGTNVKNCASGTI